MAERRYKICFPCSSGGHLAQLHCLDAWWTEHDRFWVTFKKPDAESLLADETTYWGYFPTNRSIKNLVRNSFMALRVLAKERPDVIVSNGAGLAVPYFWLGKILFGCRTVYVEVYDRIDSSPLTSRLVQPVLDEMVIQWEDQRVFYPGAVNLGQVL